MKLSITAVSGNRSFGKASVRHIKDIKTLKSLFEDINSSEESHDILQLVFMDYDTAYVKPVGTHKGDRLFQVEVGMGLDINFLLEGNTQYLSLIGDQTLKAIHLSGLSSKVVDIISPRIMQWMESVTR